MATAIAVAGRARRAARSRRPWPTTRKRLEPGGPDAAIERAADAARDAEWPLRQGQASALLARIARHIELEEELLGAPSGQAPGGRQCGRAAAAVLQTHVPMTTVLITGFEPFGAHDVNPSGEAALALDGSVLDGASLVGLSLPCRFDAASIELLDAVARHRPDWVLALGLAGSRMGFSLERVAVNLIDARLPDNAGAQPVDRPVRPDGPVAYFSTLPVKAMAQALRQAGFEAELSNSAGSYVCNQVFYELMHALARADRPAGGGFVHVGIDLNAAQVAAGVRVAVAAALAPAGHLGAQRDAGGRG